MTPERYPVRPLRIAMVGPFGFRPKKTMRARAFRLATELTARGHAVRMIMPPWHTPEEQDRVWQEDGVNIHYVALNGGAPAIVWRMIQAVRAWQPHVVHAYKPKAYSGVVAEALWRLPGRRPRVVMDADDWEGWGGWNDREDYPRPVKTLFAAQERWGMQHCDALTVASRALETLAWGHGVAPERVVYLPNGPGIDVAEQPAGPSMDARPTLLVYSRFFEFDVARLVAVVGRVRAQRPALRVLLVGASLQAADGAHLAALLAQAGLSDCIDDRGWIGEAQLPEVLAQAHVGLYLMDDNLLNRTKCPVKLADQLAVGVPVVAEAVGQVSEYLRHGVTGLLYATGDIAGVANGICTILDDSALRAQLAAGARKRILETFDWSRAAATAETAYAALLAA